MDQTDQVNAVIERAGVLNALYTPCIAYCILISFEEKSNSGNISWKRLTFGCFMTRNGNIDF
jgi:hypothetical protein